MSPEILYVEDDADDKELILIHLRHAGLDAAVSWTRNGLEALETLQRALRGESRLPALILADIKMPKMSGLELLARVRENALLAPIPFALLTSSSDQKDRAEAARLGADLFLQKPASVDGYRAIVDRLGGLLVPR